MDQRPSSLPTYDPFKLVEYLSTGNCKARPDDVIIRDSEYFVAGELHYHYKTWEHILRGFHKRDEILRYIREGVSVHDFFQHFKGDFRGKTYDSDLPPKSFFPNNRICDKFADFISETIIERVENGSLSIWGREGECEPPHLVLPITVEPKKPRMCHDERFLNLWMNTPKVSFDQITDLPRYVEHGNYQTKLDDKSGYDHISLKEDSKTFFGLCWQGWIFVYNTLPFGWSPSAYIYHTTGLGASHFIRSQGVPLSQYIDDRHIGQLQPLNPATNVLSPEELANCSLVITASILVACGYFIGIKKSIVKPVQAIPFLGFISDSVKQAFILPQEKKRTFAILRDSILQSKMISVHSLQKFAGKAVSFSLAVPAARLYTREINTNISKGLRRSKPVPMTKELYNEIAHWKFLDSWDGFLPWREEKHFHIKVTCDASNSGWGGILSLPSSAKETKGYWCTEERNTPIAVREAKALVNTLETFSTDICNGRIDAYVDNKNLVHFWNEAGGRSIPLTNETKRLFQLSLKLNISLNLIYVPSNLNAADAPSRYSSDIDSTLTESPWKELETIFGPHTFDLMAIPSNVRKSKDGHQLPFFSPYPAIGSSGVNVFAQGLSTTENYYVFPPFILIGPLIRFMRDTGIRVTFLAPDVSPKQYWWPILNSICAIRVKIGQKGQHNVLLFPPNKSHSWISKPLPWDLYAFRIVF